MNDIEVGVTLVSIALALVAVAVNGYAAWTRPGAARRSRGPVAFVAAVFVLSYLWLLIWQPANWAIINRGLGWLSWIFVFIRPGWISVRDIDRGGRFR